MPTSRPGLVAPRAPARAPTGTSAAAAAASPPGAAATSPPGIAAASPPGIAAASPPGPGIRLGPRVGWRLVLSVFKLRIGLLIALTSLAGTAIVPGGQASAARALALALAVLGASAAAGAFNQWVEADADRLMARTRRRAFASGALPRSRGWLLAIAALLAASVAGAAAAANALAAAFVLAGALTYALVYTVVLKRRTHWNIVVGGAAGSFAVLAGAAAADPRIGPEAALLALALLLWTPPHFWSLAIAHRDDYAAAGVPMLPVVAGCEHAARVVHASAVALVLVTLLPVAGAAGWPYLAGAVAGGAHLLARTRALARRPGRASAMAAFFASMVQLAMLLAGVALDAAVR